MKFSPPLQSAVLLRRYQRFLADVQLADGSVITLHCPNTGSMLRCQDSGSKVWYSLSGNPQRKYPGTWELVQNLDGAMVGINTARANALVREALDAGSIGELAGYAECRAEVAYGRQGSRIDLLLGGHKKEPDCYVEVKNVSLALDDGVGLFPDAVSRRGQKHLQELLEVAATGARAVLFFCVQHSAVREVRPADGIDGEYGRLLREARRGGVELMAWRARMSSREIRLETAVPVVLP